MVNQRPTTAPTCLRYLPTVLAVIIIWSVGLGEAGAAIRIWTGSGGTNLWMTPANWQGNQAPQAGDALVFPAGGLQTASFNNFPANTIFAGLAFGADYAIGGNPIGITGTIDAGAGTEVLIVFPVTLTGGTPVVVSSGPGGMLTFQGLISGGTGLDKIGAGTVTLAGSTPNTFTGVTTVKDGVLALQQTGGGAIPAGLVVGDGVGPLLSDIVTLHANDQITGDVSVMASGLLDLNGFHDAIGALTIASGTITSGVGLLTLGGDLLVPDGSVDATIEGHLSLGAVTRTFTIGNGGSPALLITAQVSGTAADTGIVKIGAGSLGLSGNNSYGGTTTIVDGAVMASSGSALGSPQSATIVLNHGSLHYTTTDATIEPLVLHSDNTTGALYCDNSGFRPYHGTITLFGPNQIVVMQECTLELETIAGDGSVVINDVGGGAHLLLANTYTGSTDIVAGVVLLQGNGAMPSTSDVSVHDGATLDVSGTTQGMASLTGAGHVSSSGGFLSLSMVQDAASTFAGVLSGTGQIVKSGVGRWTLTGHNTFTGTTSVTGGAIAVDGSLAGSILLSGGTLRGTGTVGTISGTSGRVQPGHEAVPGLLASQSVAWTPAITFGAIVNGPVAGSQYTRLVVTGTVNLAGAGLDLIVSSGFVPASTGEIVIIDNDGSDPVAGTFAGLAEGAIVTSASGTQFRVSYVGLTGNDVTLTPTASRYYLSEGATGSFFDTDVLIANPNAVATPITIRFLKDDGTTVTQDRVLPATSRTTIRVDDIPGMEATAFSTIVTVPSGAPLVVERTMRWDSTGYGGHTEKATAGAAGTWYFAEGSQGYFSTFLLLANPQSSANSATVHYLLEGAPAVVRTYPLPPASRVTIDVGSEAELRARSFGMIVTFTAPGVAERAMYFGTDPLWKGGHESAGVQAPANSWYVAEGATGSYFTTFLLLANPTDIDAQATLTFLPDTGVSVTTSKIVPAHGRVTVNIAQEDPSLASAAVASLVTTTGAPILVERSQYWPFTPDQWQEAHNSFGVSAPGMKWGLAEGRVGGPQAYQTYILLANPNPLPASVTIVFLREDGTTVTKSFAIAPASRLNVPVGPGTSVPELVDERFGAVITSDQAIAVERSMYWNANGIVWAAGTSATGTPLP